MVPRKMAKAECREKPVLEPGKSYYLFTDIEPWNETVRNMLYALGATTCAYPKSLSRMRPGYIMNDKEKGGGIGFLYFHV